MKRAIYFLLLLVLLALLAGYAIAGSHTRYLADDYCYDAEFDQQGFWRGQVHSYLQLMPYSSNRYSLTLFYSLGWLLGGVRFQPLLPALGVLLWGAALFYAIRRFSDAVGRKQSVLNSALIACAILFFTLLLAPNRYQILFWRSGMLTYLAPLAGNTFLGGRFLHYNRRGRLGVGGVLELGLLAWIAAGFSETIFALQTAIWGLVLLFTLWRRLPAGRSAAIVILAASAVGAALLMLCPTNAHRQSPFPPPPAVWIVAATALRFARDFLVTTLRATPLPFLALTAMGFLAGWLEAPIVSLRWRAALAWLAGMGLITAVLLVCIMAPTIWSMSAYPEPRGLLSGVFVLNLFLFGVGVWGGAAAAAALQRRLSPRLRLAAGFLLMLALGAYTARFLPTTYALIPQYQQRAEMWDARDAQILAARAAGERKLVVPGIDSIARIFELQPNEAHWVNRCAANYYRLAEIRTTE